MVHRPYVPHRRHVNTGGAATAKAPTVAPAAWADVRPPGDETLLQTWRQVGGEWPARTRAAIAALAALRDEAVNRR